MVSSKTSLLTGLAKFDVTPLAMARLRHADRHRRLALD
jgi:hypothetical protein